jgi:hypothetical protein
LIIRDNRISGFRRRRENTGSRKYFGLAPEFSHPIAVVSGRIIFGRTSKRDRVGLIPIVDKPIPPGDLHKLVSLKPVHG